MSEESGRSRAQATPEAVTRERSLGLMGLRILAWSTVWSGWGWLLWLSAFFVVIYLWGVAASRELRPPAGTGSSFGLRVLGMWLAIGAGVIAIAFLQRLVSLETQEQLLNYISLGLSSMLVVLGLWKLARAGGGAAGPVS